MSLVIRGGMVLDTVRGRFERLDVLTEKDRISALYPPGDNVEIPEGAVEINAEGKLVVPGLVDMHVHLREPGQEHKETIESGSLSAVAGGFTAIACMPNTKPVNDCVEVTEFVKNAGIKAGFARVYPIASVSIGQAGKVLTDFAGLKASGAVGVSDDGFTVVDSALMRKALVEAKRSGLLPISHSEDPWLSRGGVVNEGNLAEHLGIPGIPSASEEIVVFREILLAKLTGCPVHIAHVSTRGSVEIIRRAKQEGIPVTAETAPHYFTLDETAVMKHHANAKMNPPLRSGDDVTAIKKGLSEGVIDVIATDHAPHSPSEKAVGLRNAPFGIIGLQTALPLTLGLVREGVLALADALAKLTIKPASILGVPGGVLSEGGAADIGVMDIDEEYILDESIILSRSCNSPFIGMKLTGRNVAGVVGGKLVWDSNRPNSGLS
jgi:dihydroorotase